MRGISAKKLFHPRPILLALIVGLASPQVFGQQSGAPDATANEVLVTAQPLDVLSPSAAEAEARLQNVPGAVNAVTSDDYRLGRHDYLDDFLRYQPGLVIESAQGTEDTHVSSRGSGQDSDDIFGLTILVDGIPINQGDGEAFLYDVDLQTAKYAEVYRGADALRYGGVTLGGAINLVSVTGRDASPAAVGVSFGSFGYYQQEASSGWSNGPLDAYVSFTNHIQSGYQDFSQENFQKVSVNFGYRIGDSMENRFYFYYGRLDQNNPSSVTKQALYADPRGTEDEAIQEDWSTKWDYVRLLDRFAVSGSDWTFQASLEWNHRQQTQRSEYEDDFRLGAVRFYSDDYAADVTFESNAEWFGQNNRFTAGLIPSFEPESDAFYADPTGNIGALLFADRTYYLNLPVVLENQHYFTSRFSLLTGFQAVYVNRIFQDGYHSVTLGDQSHRDHYLAFNPKLGLAYQWNDKCLVYINGSRSFQPPSFDESLGIAEGVTGGQVFHELESQKGISLEVGTRGEWGPLTWDLALYRTWLRDELLALNNDQGVPLGTVNAPRTVHQGLELGTELELAHSLLTKCVAGSRDKDGKDGKDRPAPTPTSKAKTDRIVFEQTYNLSDFRFDGNAAYSDNRIAGNPVQFYKAEIRYEHPCGVYFGPNVEWNIVKYPVDEANSLFADPYALLGVRAGYKTVKGLDVYVEAKNLTNKTYAAYVEPIADARTGDETDSFSPGNGRAFYGGLSYNW